MAKYICNQDKDRIYPLDFMSLHPRISTDLNHTIQLVMNYKGKTVTLGDFDSFPEVVMEVIKIGNCREKMYVVSGYSNGGAEEW